MLVIISLVEIFKYLNTRSGLNYIVDLNISNKEIIANAKYI